MMSKWEKKIKIVEHLIELLIKNTFLKEKINVIPFIRYAVNRKIILSVIGSTLLCTFIHQGWLHLNDDEVISVACFVYVEFRDVDAI